MIVANTAIGIVQEVRAKRVLDRLACSRRPRPTPGDGEIASWRSTASWGDALHLEPGDQVVADGRVAAARALSIDESILTGESDQVAKARGRRGAVGRLLRAGAGDYEVERVGADSFAERLALEARSTRSVLSPLQQDINRVLEGDGRRDGPARDRAGDRARVRGPGARDSVETAVAALVPLVPEGSSC